MRIAYEDWNPKPAARAIVDQANSICLEYQAQGYNLTLRQLYYQFVARDLIPNNMQAYKRLGSYINSARLAGMLDWDYIVDRTRNLAGTSHWSDPADVIRSVSTEVPLTATITIPLDEVLARYGYGPGNWQEGEGPEPDFYSNRSELTEAVARLIVAEMDSTWKYGLRSRIDEIARQVVADQLRERIVEIFDQEITKTDGLGNATSLPKPFRQMVMDEAINWANNRTDRYGGKETNLGKILTAQVDKAFTEECGAAVAEAKQKIKAVLAQHGAKILAASVEDMKLIDLTETPDTPPAVPAPPTL